MDTFDGINIWIEDLTGTNAKRKILEAKQDLVTLRELDETIGKHLDITWSDTQVLNNSMEMFDPNQNVITFTDKALSHFSEVVAENQAIGIRLRLEGGGCAG